MVKSNKLAFKGGAIGITATRRGLTDYQLEQIELLFVKFRPKQIHHGDCVGGDEQIDALAEKMGIIRVSHPASAERVGASLVANCQTEYYHDPLPPLERDREIVEHTEFIIGAPHNLRNTKSSGTWYTLRYAVKEVRKHAFIIFKHEKAGVVHWKPGESIDYNL